LYLLSHGVELALKAYLRAQGLNLTALRRIGHDLTRCLQEAERAGLDQWVRLEDSDRTLVDWINVYYGSKDFEYVNTQGLKTLPDVGSVESTLAKLVVGLRDPCLQATKRERRGDAAAGGGSSATRRERWSATKKG
jgi:hypothetical protein